MEWFFCKVGGECYWEVSIPLVVEEVISNQGEAAYTQWLLNLGPLLLKEML